MRYGSFKANAVRMMVSAVVALGLSASLPAVALAHGKCDPGDRPEAGTVLSVQGKAMVVKPGGSQYEAKAGTVIRPEDVVETEAGGSVELAIEDGTESHGTRLVLGPASRARFASDLASSFDPVENSYVWMMNGEVCATLLQGTAKATVIAGSAFRLASENVKVAPPDYASTWKFEAAFEVETAKDPSKKAGADPLADPASQDLIRGMLMMYGATSLDQLPPEQRQQILLLVQMNALYGAPLPVDVVTQVKVGRGKVTLVRNFDRGWDKDVTVYKGEYSTVTGTQPPTDPIPF